MSGPPRRSHRPGPAHCGQKLSPKVLPAPLFLCPVAPAPAVPWQRCAEVTCTFQVVKKKHRTRMLEFFIDVARECFNIGNFNSMMAIICE